MQNTYLSKIKNMHDITTLKQTPQRTTAYTGWLSVGFRTCIEGKHPKTRKQTHKTYTQVQSTHDKMCQHEQQHGIHIIVGQGGQYIPMVGIYGQECVWWDLRTWWDIVMRLVGDAGGRCGSGFGHTVYVKCTQTIIHNKGYRWSQ